VNHKRVLLIVGGGVAAYKALELVRLLRKAGVAVRPILTAGGARFVTALSLGALAEDAVRSDLFSLEAEAEMGHIELSRSADLVVVAPATADLMAKAANGLADDLASTTLLATDKPVMMAPAMNVRMWLHPATQRNLATLRGDGVAVVGPDEGAMACGEYGPGRMAEPEAIFQAVMQALDGDARPLAGRHVLVTAGPTAEPIDPVRVLTNRSSGKQGYAIAGALADRLVDAGGSCARRCRDGAGDGGGLSARAAGRRRGLRGGGLRLATRRGVSGQAQEGTFRAAGRHPGRESRHPRRLVGGGAIETHSGGGFRRRDQ
jgi:phosphopantothenoylcysteine decarboxylase / phosphopantothenate---cysteine ligase